MKVKVDIFDYENRWYFRFDFVIGIIWFMYRFVFLMLVFILNLDLIFEVVGIDRL